jgi:hypothetical protein
MSDAINQHKKMAMGGNCYKKGGSVQKPPMNFGPPKMAPKAPPKTGFNDSPIEKVKRVNGVKGV